MYVSLSVRLSVCIEQLRFHWTYFQQILHFNIFPKSVGNIRFWLKPDKNNGYFHEDLCTFIVTYRWILFWMFHTEVVKDTKTYILWSI